MNKENSVLTYPDLTAPIWNAIRIGAAYFVVITLTLIPMLAW